MKFTIDPKIFEKFPGATIGVLVITSMDNRGHNGEILKLLREEERLQKEKLTKVAMGSLPEVAIWRKIYKEFGSDPRDFRSSVEALLRRARGGEKPLPQINNLVDIYNYISLKYHLPVGAEDLDKVEGDIELSFAKGVEKGRYIGSDTEDICYEGEVIYKDDKGFVCRRWNWREADRTKIDFETKNAVLVIESAPGLDSNELETALVEAVVLISKYLSGEIQKFILDHTNYHIDIDFQTGKKTKEFVQTESKQKKAEEKIARPKSTIPKLMDDSCLEDKNLVSFILRQVILEAVSDIFGSEIKAGLDDIELEHPKIENYGDYATNIAMRLARQLKMKPQDIAKNISDKINEYIREDKTITLSADSKDSKGNKINISEILENIDTETIGVGFINFKLKQNFLISLAFQLLRNKNIVKLTQKKQTSVKTTARKKIAIEHTQPNTNKPMHIGHIRNSILGMSLVHIFRNLGWEVISTNVNNDRGVHICKSMWAYLSFGQKSQNSKVDINKLSWRNLLDKWVGRPTSWLMPEEAKIKPDHFVGDFYVAAARLEVDHPKVGEDVAEMLQAWENDDACVHRLWERMNGWFYQGRDMTLLRLGIVLDEETYESKLYKKGKKIIEDGAKKKIFTTLEDGAIQAVLSKFGLPDKILIRRDGTAIYMTFDIQLTKERLFEKKYDLGVWVVGSDQILHFKQLFAICEMLGFMKAGQGYHLPYGMVYLSGGEKMSSREGNVVYADRIIDKMVDLARKKAKSARLQISLKEMAKVAEKVGIGALKYSMLKVNPMMDIYFDIDKSVSLEGDSGPYLLYTYARCKSVMRKAGLLAFSLKLPKLLKSPKEISPEEQALLRVFYRFPEVVTEAARALSPSVICGYLYDLAQKYNLFYQKHSILNIKNETMLQCSNDTISFRLFLTGATAEVLKRGLNLLGIETVEKM